MLPRSCRLNPGHECPLDTQVQGSCVPPNPGWHLAPMELAPRGHDECLLRNRWQREAARLVQPQGHPEHLQPFHLGWSMSLGAGLGSQVSGGFPGTHGGCAPSQMSSKAVEGHPPLLILACSSHQTWFNRMFARRIYLHVLFSGENSFMAESSTRETATLNGLFSYEPVLSPEEPGTQVFRDLIPWDFEQRHLWAQNH